MIPQAFQLVVFVGYPRERPPFRQSLADERNTRRGGVALENLVDQPERERLLGPNRIAREDHRHRLFPADQTRQPLRAAGAWKEAELDLRQAKPRRSRRDAEMTGEGDFQP